MSCTVVARREIFVGACGVVTVEVTKGSIASSWRRAHLHSRSRAGHPAEYCNIRPLVVLEHLAASLYTVTNGYDTTAYCVQAEYVKTH